MNNIAIARHLRGLSNKVLADELGITYQQIGNWEQGLRNPGRTWAQKLAEALDVDVAWIMDCPQAAALRDPMTGEVLACKILRSEQIDDYGVLYHLYVDVTGDVVAQIVSDGVTFTPCDWQSAQPKTAAEIAEYRWMDGCGRDAVMLDGLPRVLGA